MTHHLQRIALCILGVLVIRGVALAQESAPVAETPAAEAAPDVQALPVIVVAVQGQVQVRDGQDQPWRDAAVDMRVTQGAEFRTGLRSAVQLRIPPDQIITLDRLGTLTVLQAVRQQQGNQTTTDLGLKYGRTRYQIEAADQLHNSTIRTASATLAVRGSDIVVDDTVLGFSAQLQSEHGVVTRFKELNLSSSFGQRGKVEVTGERWQAANQARHTASVDPVGRFAVQTFTEQELQDIDTGVGGFAYRGVAELQRQFNALGGTGVGVPEVDGPLIFTTSWFSSDFVSPSDIDMSLDIPGLGKLTSSVGSLGDIPNQYVHSGNDLGLAGGGSESVTAALSFLGGSHSINIVNNSAVQTQVFVTVERGPLADLIFNTSAVLEPSQSQTFTVSPR